LAVVNDRPVNETLPRVPTDNGYFLWQVRLLPFVDHKELNDAIAHPIPWNSPTNSCLHSQVPHGSKCRNREADSSNTTVFAIVLSDSFWRSGPLDHSDITECLSCSLVHIELDLPNVNWMAPTNLALDDLLVILNEYGTLPSPHPDGVVMAFADESVALIAHDRIAPPFRRAIVLISGCETVQVQWD